MALSSVLILVLTVNELVTLDAFHCRKGERIVVSKNDRSCQACPDGYYQDADNDSQKCKPCKNCHSGSFVQEMCTKVTDTKCQCKTGFVPTMEGSILCKCDQGHEPRGNDCVRCNYGYFSPGHNAPCKKWTDCKVTGEKVYGTSTSDAICNEQTESNLITIASTSNQSVTFTRLTTHRPHEGAQTQMRQSTTSTTPQANDSGRAQPPNHINSANHFGQVLLIFGIAMLVVLTLVTCKLSVHPYLKKGPTSRLNDSLCRPPVEESGDSSESSTIKLNPEP